MISIVFVIGAWGVAVPLAYVLTFKLNLDLGLVGIWYGLTAGYGIVTFASLAAVLSGDWQKASDAAVATAMLHQTEKTDKTESTPGLAVAGPAFSCQTGGGGSSGAVGGYCSIQDADNSAESTPLLTAALTT